MAPDLSNVAGRGAPIASDIRAEVDAVVGTLDQRIREVNRKVLPHILPLRRVSGVHIDRVSDLGESRAWRT